MNKEFEQWVKENFQLTVIGRDIVEKVYLYLKQNPHLLREDGEKEIQDPMTYAQSMAKKEMKGYLGRTEADQLNPRPTDMEQEAREQCDSEEQLFDIFKQQKP